MLRFTKFIAIAAVAAASASVAGAQSAVTPTKPFSLGLSGGASVPLGDFADAVNTGYDLNGHLGLAAPGLPISFRGDVGYNDWGAKDDDASAHMWSFTANAVYTIPSASLVRPYIIGGIGAYKPSVSSGDVSVSDDTRFGFNVGGGLTIPLSGFNAFVEARYNRVSTEGDATSYVPINFGIMF